MNEVTFVDRHSVDWKSLNHLCDRAENSLKALSVDEFKELVRVYRRVSSDLSLVRTKSDNTELIAFLNDLVARAYAILYRSRRKRLRIAIAEAIVLSARTVRKLQWFVAATLAIFFGSVAFGYVALAVSPKAHDILVPPSLGPTFEKWKSGEFDDRTGEQSLAATGFYGANNPVVALNTGATAAATFGLSTVNSIYRNGILMGSLAHEVQSVGKLGHLLVSIAPHGVTEISGIILAGAAGLSLGWALLCPGRRRRGEALAIAGKDAVVVLVTSIILMYMAAPVEGFFSFNPNIPNVYKAIFASLSAIGWAFFWFGYGRKNEE